jgi:hypothetical protein
MDHHIKEYYRQYSDETPGGNFHSVIALHEAPDTTWKSLHAQIPALCRGWCELAQLSPKDRIEFTRDFWLSKLPYRAGMDEFLDRFFLSLDDIGIFVTQKKFEDPYVAHMVYSVKDNGGFFRGNPPIQESQLRSFQKYFSESAFPLDYLAFLQVHDGFCKTTDCTGVIASGDVAEVYEKLQNFIQKQDPIVTDKGVEVNPKKLIPFYESFGMPFFQCFWAEWYPEQEMGNVYYSGVDKTISDVSRIGSETMAFATFIDWLMFYLERIE